MGSKELLGDAGKGAALGSVAGPWGTLIGGAAGGLYGEFFDNSQEDADKAAAQAQAAKIEALRQAGIKIDAYRPELMAMEQAGKQEQLGQYGGTQSLLAAMQGQGQGPDLQRNNPASMGDRAINPAMLRASSAPGQGGMLSGAQRPQPAFGPQVPISPMAMRRG